MSRLVYVKEPEKEKKLEKFTDKAKMLLNRKKKKGFQILLKGENFQIKMPLFRLCLWWNCEALKAGTVMEMEFPNERVIWDGNGQSENPRLAWVDPSSVLSLQCLALLVRMGWPEKFLLCVYTECFSLEPLF